MTLELGGKPVGVAHSTKRVWVHYLAVGRVIVGAVDDPSKPFSLVRPVEIGMGRPDQAGRVNMDFGNPFMPLNPPKDQRLELQPYTVMQSFELDAQNKELLAKYREITAGVITGSPGLVGSPY